MKNICPTPHPPPHPSSSPNSNIQFWGHCLCEPAEPELQRLMVLSVSTGTNRYASVPKGESEHIIANQLAVFSII